MRCFGGILQCSKGEKCVRFFGVRAALSERIYVRIFSNYLISCPGPCLVPDSDDRRSVLIC